MKRLVLLLATAMLIAQPAVGMLGIGQASSPFVPAQKGWLQLAASHKCGAYGKANHCKAHWDGRTRACVCTG